MSTPRISRTIRWQLVALVLAFMLPTVAAAIATIVYVYAKEKAGFSRGLAETTRALALVVDRELSGREALLKVMAESPSLTTGDLASFYAYAKAVAPSPSMAIGLARPDGTLLMNTLRPLGSELPKVMITMEKRRAVGPRATAVTDLFMAPLGGAFSFAVEVPVVRNGEVLYYLAMGQFASNLQKVMADQRLPPGWIGTIVDSQDRVVARLPNPEKFVNTRARDEVLQKLAAAKGEAVSIRALDGSAVLASFSRSPAYGWAVFVGVPEAQITSPIQAAAIFSALAALLLSGSLIAALRLGRRLVDPVASLANAANELGQGRPVEIGHTGLHETEVVAEALRSASESVTASSALLQQRVSEALLEAERANQSVIRSQRMEAVGQLTGGVAHDFNNLLMVVSTNVHLLRRRAPDTTPELARIERAVATGTKLTRQLLSFARRQPLRPQRVDLAQALPELMDLVRPTLGGQVSVECEVAAGLPCITVDPAEFELALINLSINARDAMPGGGTLRVTARSGSSAQSLPSGGETVIVEVADSGTGIDRAVLDRVFEPFFTTKPVGHGTGLGLSQVYGMVTQAGGTAQIASEPGQGTRLTLVFPAAVPESQREEAAKAVPAHAGLRGVVLLVEDNVALARVTLDMLVLEGCTVYHAADADEAVRLWPELNPRPRVVLSDIRMPGSMDGIGLAAWLRNEAPSVPVVLMTGYTPELEAARALQLDVLAKPVEPRALIELLARLLAPALAATSV